MKIEVKTYEESRLEFFKDLARKAEKKLDKCMPHELTENKNKLEKKA